MVASIPKLPNGLLIEIGRVATAWAYLEQEILLQTSALAAQYTEGLPIEYLRTDFKRLRSRWYALASERFDKKTHDKIINPLNARLAEFSRARAYVLHGTWKHIGNGVYEVSWYEQKTSLEHFRMKVRLSYIRDTAVGVENLLHDFLRFTCG